MPAKVPRCVRNLGGVGVVIHPPPHLVTLLVAAALFSAALSLHLREIRRILCQYPLIGKISISIYFPLYKNPDFTILFSLPVMPL